MVQWEKCEGEQQGTDLSTSKETLMMQNQTQNQMVETNIQVLSQTQSHFQPQPQPQLQPQPQPQPQAQNQQTQEQAPKPVRRGPYVPPPPELSLNPEMSNAQPIAEVKQKIPLVQVVPPAPPASPAVQQCQQDLASPQSELRQKILSKFEAAVDWMVGELNRLKKTDWQKTAISLAVYGFLVGGAISGAVAGSDHFFKFLGEHMYTMGSGMNDNQPAIRVKTANLSSS